MTDASPPLRRPDALDDAALAAHTPMMAHYLRKRASTRVLQAFEVFWLTVGGAILDRWALASA
ncbi:MAG: hypothetical protein QM702_12060 [Rubrivivax sp.]